MSTVGEAPRSTNEDGTLVMPRIGFGVYKIPPTRCEAACMAALDAGYRQLDCAQLYRSESQVASAVRRSGLPRSDVFLTTKVKTWRGGDPAELYASLLKSVQKLGETHRDSDGDGDDDDGRRGEDAYVDLFLVHTPRIGREGAREQVWRALERLKREGKAREIGVSNYGVGHLEEMRSYATCWPPSVNQIELHPWCQQRDLVAYCDAHGITVQAYSPLAAGARLQDPTLGAVAERCGKSPAQVLVRYALQKGWVPLPKTERADRARENIDVWGFELDRTAMGLLDALDEGRAGAVFPVNFSGS